MPEEIDPREGQTESCRRCGAAIPTNDNDFPPLCDDCYALAGSCCQNWEDADSCDELNA